MRACVRVRGGRIAQALRRDRHRSPGLALGVLSWAWLVRAPGTLTDTPAQRGDDPPWRFGANPDEAKDDVALCNALGDCQVRAIAIGAGTGGATLPTPAPWRRFARSDAYGSRPRPRCPSTVAASPKGRGHRSSESTVWPAGGSAPVRVGAESPVTPTTPFEPLRPPRWRGGGHPFPPHSCAPMATTPATRRATPLSQ